MAETHIVQPGECVLSIAESLGVYWKRIWEASENEELKARRSEPNILAPGDELYIPDRELREESAETEARHRYRVQRGVELRIRVHDMNGPRANQPYHLEAEGKIFKGETKKTDKDGLAVIRVPAALLRGILVLGKAEDEYEIFIGFMDPHDSVTGQHARLQNMGYHVGGVQSDWDHDSIGAIRQFVLDRQAEEKAGDYKNPNDTTNIDLVRDAYSI